MKINKTRSVFILISLILLVSYFISQFHVSPPVEVINSARLGFVREIIYIKYFNEGQYGLDINNFYNENNKNRYLFKDTWGNLFLIKYLNDKNFKIISLGPDKLLNTNDDIIIESHVNWENQLYDYYKNRKMATP